MTNAIVFWDLPQWIHDWADTPLVKISSQEKELNEHDEKGECD